MFFNIYLSETCENYVLQDITWVLYQTDLNQPVEHIHFWEHKTFEWIELSRKYKWAIFKVDCQESELY